MNHTETRPRRDAAGSPAHFLLALLLIALSLGLTLYRLNPPAAVGAGAPPSDFSSARALEQLKIVSSRPRPAGSEAEAGVREHIIRELSAQGLSPEVQSAVSVSKGPARTVAASVQNILARLPGTGPERRALMLVAHYDSVPHSPGASDDGSGVVVLLETLRALRAGPPLKNDVLFLFTGGEEVGLMGARAFVEQHPAAGDVALVLNFEARGAGGPVYMFETSEQNGWLIEEFGEAAPRPVASSLMYALYKRLPNDTDLSVFKNAGLAGLNFAYLGDARFYHTALDSVQNLDERSLQHHGSYALALARHFGNAGLAHTRAPDAVYFDLLGAAFVSYPLSWTLPLTALVALLFVFVLGRGLRRKELSPGGLGAGLLAFVLTAAAAAGGAALLWMALRALHPEYSALSNAGLYTCGFTALAVALVSAVYLRLTRRIGVYNASLGAWLPWLLLAVGAALFLPAASYLFVWPLLFSLVGLVVSFAPRGGRGGRAPSAGRLLLLHLCTLPALILLTATIYGIYEGLLLEAVPLLVLLEVLLLGFLIPHLGTAPARFGWLLPALALLAGVGFVVAGHLTPAYSDEHPRANSVVYTLDADLGRATWTSDNRAVDAWTAQFFPDPARRQKLPELFPNTELSLLAGDAPAVNLPPEELAVLADETAGETRRLHLRITSPRRARILGVYLEPRGAVRSATVNGRRADYADAPAAGPPGNWWELAYRAAPPEGLDLWLEVKAAEELKLKVVGQSDGLPEAAAANYRGRPRNLIPAGNSDVTRVVRTFSLKP